LELLSPAGNFEKLKAAVTYGADAVYFGGESFSLRAKAGNFDLEEMREAMRFLHERGKKGYLTLNSFMRDYEAINLAEYVVKAAETGVDAFIVSDPGVFAIAKRHTNIPLFISTQANTTNSEAISFWAAAGASRVILARELSKAELGEIMKDPACEVEIFAHGAICISYSGRCLISAYMTGRDANRGECTQPCRWNYTLTEATRPGQTMDIVEEPDGTYLYNAKDLCLVDKVGELMKMGIASLKIEGRMKSVMYTAVVTGVYRKVIDSLAADPNYVVDERLKWLLSSVSNRHYTEGFYSGSPDDSCMNYATSAYVRNADFLGVVEAGEGGKLRIDCRGRFHKGETLHLLLPDLSEHELTAEIEADYTKPGQKVLLTSDINAPQGSLLRREVNRL
jgi:putative protease